MRHIELIADGVIASVKAFVSRETGILAKAFNDRMAAWEARIAAIPAGPPGEKGEPGESIRGERGEKGDPGESIKGDPGENGKDAVVDQALLRAMAGEEVARAVAALPRPADGAVGPSGAPGKDGADGHAGKSAYQLAVERGFSGAELQWLDSLNGKPGRDGANGKDAAPVDVTAIARDAAALVPVPRDGKDADPDVIRAEVERAVSAIPKPQDGAPGKPGRDGKDIDPAMLNDAIDRKVADAVAKLPAPKDGKDGSSIHPDTVAVMVREAVDSMPRQLVADGRDGKDGEPGPAGKDADPVIIAQMVADGVAQALPGAVQRAIDALMPDIIAKAAEAVPRPMDGKDAPAVDTGAIARDVLAMIPAPRDGRDGRDAPELDTVVEAVVKRLPEVKDGRDGRDAPPIDMDAVVAKAVALIPVPINGADGTSITLDDVRPILEAETARWQLEFERRATDTLQRAVEKMPAPANGSDGKDGLSVDDFEITLDGRVFTFALRCGDRIVKRDIKVPFPIDRGVYRSGMKAEQGDVVTYGGSQWIAVKDTQDKPPSDAWRLQVRRGQDGKDAPA